MTTSSISLPSLPKNWDAEEDIKVFKKLSKCVCKLVEPAGAAFSARVRRHRQKRSLEEDYELTQALLEADADNGEDDEDEPESAALLRSDPSKWKSQDHYAVLGLSKKRYLANGDDIKRAHRRKVLKHHPDKIAVVGGSDSFFKCIQKAWEVLTDPKKRRQFDSCDPTFDEGLPPAKVSDDFYDVYSAKFASEARFSKKGESPAFGTADSTEEEVNAFYIFWGEFESWRTFEMRDEEDTDKADSRDEKRWLDRKNFAARKKHKKEDTQRVIKLVDQAFNLDPRVKKFKEQQKYAKSAKKREREAAERAVAEEAARIAEVERIAAEKAELDEKERLAIQRKERDSSKNIIKKEKKTIRRIFRDNNSFMPSGGDADSVAFQTDRLEQALNTSDSFHLESLRAKFEKVLDLGSVALGLVLDEEYYTSIEAVGAVEAGGAWSQKSKDALVASFKKHTQYNADRWSAIVEDVKAAGDDHGELACILQAKCAIKSLGGLPGVKR